MKVLLHQKHKIGFTPSSGFDLRPRSAKHHAIVKNKYKHKKEWSESTIVPAPLQNITNVFYVFIYQARQQTARERTDFCILAYNHEDSHLTYHNIPQADSKRKKLRNQHPFKKKGEVTVKTITTFHCRYKSERNTRIYITTKNKFRRFIIASDGNP